MTPTPGQLAEADKIDVTRYAGHTPWPWNSEYVAGAIRHLVRNCVAECFVFEDDWNAMNASGFYGWKKYEDSPLITDAPLLPVVVHQRDAARAERDALREKCARYERALNKIAQWHDGPTVNAAFDEPGSAAEAREALPDAPRKKRSKR